MKSMNQAKPREPIAAGRRKPALEPLMDAALGQRIQSDVESLGAGSFLQPLPVLVPIEIVPVAIKQPTLLERLKAHISIARLDHSIKNIFVIPGIVVSIGLLRAWPQHLLSNLLLGFVAVTLVACSNYVINEVLDAPFDRLHPIKKNRPAAQGLVNIRAAYAQWIGMMLAGLAIAWQISLPFTASLATLWIMGCVYNIRPIRAKDVVYLDVLTESVNNPLRMLLGWYMVTSSLVPPVSLLCFYWMLGCYLMGLKRFSELREIGDRQLAGSYRESFKSYTEESLLQSVIFYASFAMLLFGAFIMRYRIELILAFPLVALIMCTYFKMAFEKQSSVQNPEKLYKEPVLMIEVALTVVAFTALLFVNLPWFTKAFAPSLFR
jgi:decaprenyl-phosphate phosphoribosyltransferase